MRVLLDECAPRPIRNHLPGHEVFTVELVGLKGLSNGALIAAAEAQFDVLITADQNLRYQQNLSNRKLAIVELPFNSWPRLKPLVQAIAVAVNSISAGAYVRIT